MSLMIDQRARDAGLLYCSAIFVAGVVLGAIRTFWVAPLAGEIVAVALEAPILLAFCWSACGWVGERLEGSENFLDRLIMGGGALAVLVCAEALIALFQDKRTATQHMLLYGESAILLGLLAQLGFAIFPLLRTRRNGVR
jgi:hypothetical protein